MLNSVNFKFVMHQYVYNVVACVSVNEDEVSKKKKRFVSEKDETRNVFELISFFFAQRDGCQKKFFEV